MTAKTAIMGGTFDPVHHGHLIIARAIAEARGLEKVILMPAASPPHKAKAVAEANARRNMLEMAIHFGEPFAVDGRELRRPGLSFTVDTVEELRREKPGQRPCLIIGADMLAELPQWHRSRDLLEMADFLVARRPGMDVEAVLSRLKGQIAPEALCRLHEGVVTTPMVDISSSEIRARVAAGLSIRYLVPETVRLYIANLGLYERSGGG